MSKIFWKGEKDRKNLAKILTKARGQWNKISLTYRFNLFSPAPAPGFGFSRGEIFCLSRADFIERAIAGDFFEKKRIKKFYSKAKRREIPEETIFPPTKKEKKAISIL